MSINNIAGTGPTLAKGTKRALLIGVDSYPVLRERGGLQRDPSLHGCVNDAIAVRDFCVSNLGILPANILLLLAPHPENPLRPDLGTTSRSTRQAIQQAFIILATQTQVGDEVVIYFAGHAVRIGFNPNPDPDDEGAFQPNRADPYENLSALAPDDVGWDGSNLLLGPELHAYVQQVVKPGVRATILLDCCHATGAARGLDDAGVPTAIREITLNCAEFNRETFAAEHGTVPPPSDGSGTRGIATAESGWRLDLADLVTVAACQYNQLSNEYPRGAADARGAFTRFLLEVLTNVNAAQATNITWDQIRSMVITRVAEGVKPKQQTPTFEGAIQRPIFGGAWRPAPPGITVTTAPGTPLLTLGAGEIAGVGLNAEVAIYPPDIRSFTPVDTAGLIPVKARIVQVSGTYSQAMIIDPPNAIVADGSQALVIQPSTPSIGVALLNMPDELATVIRNTPGVDTFLNFAVPAAQVVVQVCQRKDVDGQAGWVLIKPPQGGGQPTVNDVIAYATFWDPDRDLIPPQASTGPEDLQALGTLIAAGLVQWARYHAVLNRKHDMSALHDALTLSLRASSNRATVLSLSCNDEMLTRAGSDSDPVEVRSDEWLLCKVKVGGVSPGPLNVAIMGCSDDGNIFLLWPPQHGQNLMAVTEEQCVGAGARFEPFQLQVRRDQTRAAYTFKLFASDQDQPFDTRSLVLDQTVQAVINELASPSTALNELTASPLTEMRGLTVTSSPLPPPDWTVHDLRCVVTKPDVY